MSEENITVDIEILSSVEKIEVLELEDVSKEIIHSGQEEVKEEIIDSKASDDKQGDSSPDLQTCVEKNDENCNINSENAADIDNHLENDLSPNDCIFDADISSNPSNQHCNNSNDDSNVGLTPSISQIETIEQRLLEPVKTYPQCIYHVKWIKFNDENTPIVTQNENGPCPLLALINVLLLQRRIKFTERYEVVTSAQLLDYLANCIFENPPQNISEDIRLNYEQNMQDAMSIFHKLQTGLDVNVKFTGASHFEYTPECIVFDLLSIPLYHGWLVDPESLEIVAAIGSCSYNQLVEKIIANKNSQKQEFVTEALLAEDFLEHSASQLTYHGLCELNQKLSHGQLCVFFRNNHFSTLHCHKDELFLLVTDQGFLSEENVIWETLSNVEGDGHFVDAYFHSYTKPEIPPEQPTSSMSNDQNLNHDYLVALSLQEENYSTYASNDNPEQRNVSDRELAMQLQEEENRLAEVDNNNDNVSSQSSMRQLPQLNPNSQREKKKQSECIII